MTIEITTLPNGIRVITDTLNSVETVTFGAWIGVGTRDEPPGVNGIAHFLEHMVFKGTKRRTPFQIAEEIEAVGGQMNAYTSRENTAFYARLLADDVLLAVDTVADLMQNALFDEEELRREKQVVLQEIGQLNDTPDEVIFDHFQECAFRQQPLGRPVLGRPDSVVRLKRDDLVNYLSLYGSENIILAASGRIDHAPFVEMAEEHFGNFARRTSPQRSKASYKGGDYREGRPLDQAHLLMGFEGVSYDDPDYYAVVIYSTLLGGGMSSRLFQEIRERRGLVYSIYSFCSSFADSGLFGLYAGTGQEELSELAPVVCDMLLESTVNITAEEVQRAVAQLKASILMGRESTLVRCEQMAHQLLVFGRVIPPEEIVAIIEAVTVQKIQAAAKRLLSSRLTITGLGPLSSLESYDSIAQRMAA